MLSLEEKQIIFDHSLGITEQKSEAEDLISSNPQAKQLYERLKLSLSPLDTLEDEECPAHLVDGTVLKLKQTAERSNLEKLIDQEQQRGETKKISPFWPNLGRRLATAAVFMLVGTAILSAINYMHQHSIRTQCQSQLSKIYRGMTSYSSDHNENLPSVSASTGSPWWKIGYEGQENHSNTRNLWLLPKHGYVNQEQFVCPGSNVKQVKIDPDTIKMKNDFPSRNSITYSFQLICDQPVNMENLKNKVIMADLNPLFENLPPDYSADIKIELNEKLASQNSSNHGRKGQNVLFGDGSVRFVKQRTIGIDKDDIFTLKEEKVYDGNEVPKCKEDSFLVP